MYQYDNGYESFGTYRPWEGWKISCLCGTTLFHPEKEEAIKRWNTRPIEDALRARLEAAEAYIEALKKTCLLDTLEIQTSREAWEKEKGNGNA